jgi:hypothetical protein
MIFPQAHLVKKKLTKLFENMELKIENLSWFLNEKMFRKSVSSSKIHELIW